MNFKGDVFDVNDCSDAALRAAANFDEIMTRLYADLSYHQKKAEAITRDCLDIDTCEEDAYTIEDDCAESYHAGRVAALADVLNMLAGHPVTLYSETEA